jgi:uncharacterized protein with GYD domain
MATAARAPCRLARGERASPPAAENRPGPASGSLLLAARWPRPLENRKTESGPIGNNLGVPTYITLMKWTSQGMGGIPAWRDRVEEAERAIEQRGGKLLDAFVTLGRYDVVEIFEAPNDETAYQILIEVARHGQVTTETLRAFSREEAEAIVRAS